MRYLCYNNYYAPFFVNELTAELMQCDMVVDLQDKLYCIDGNYWHPIVEDAR